MSNYESLIGTAKFKKADFAKLKKELIEAYNTDLENKFNAAEIKKFKLKKSSSRTIEFEMLEKGLNCVGALGEVTLDKENSTVKFCIDEANHAIRYAASTCVYNTIMKAISRMEKKGKTYGARTVRYDEMSDSSKVKFYGGWSE